MTFTCILTSELLTLYLDFGINLSLCNENGLTLLDMISDEDMPIIKEPVC